MQLLTMRRPAQPAPVPKAAFAAGGNTHSRMPCPRMPSPQRPAVHVAPPAPGWREQDLPRDIASRFGRRVRELRQARSMTQVEVSVHFGIDRTFISDVERGRKGVCLPTLEVFALGFGVSLSDLLRGL